MLDVRDLGSRRGVAIDDVLDGEEDSTELTELTELAARKELMVASGKEGLAINDPDLTEAIEVIEDIGDASELSNGEPLTEGRVLVPIAKTVDFVPTSLSNSDLRESVVVITDLA
jgi:hypothetical protein